MVAGSCFVLPAVTITAALAWVYVTYGALPEVEPYRYGIKPGPVLSTATFIGYVLAGAPGAALATVGIFLPSFFFVLALNPLVPKLRRSAWMGAFLDAVNVAAVGLIAAVTLQLGAATLHSWPAWVIAALATLAVLRFKLNAAWIVLGGAALGRLLA